MAPVIALLIIALVSLLAVRVGATALMMTGLSWDTASFQSYSAFFGVGFTTKEAEMVVNHPVRRRIIRDLILVGNVGLTSALATLVVTMLQSSSGGNGLVMFGWLIGGLAALFFISRLTWFQNAVDHVIQRGLEGTGMVRALDYELLLRIQHGYVVSEIEVLPDSFLAGRTLRESRPWDRGVVILAIKRDNQTNPGIPNRDDIVKAGDVVTAYGKETSLHAMTQPFPAAAVAA
jgi:TrkA-C domain